MKLPDELVDQQFDRLFIRGAVIRFEFDGFLDSKRSQKPGPKFAIILNVQGVTDPAYLALTTSKTTFFDKTRQFETVILRIGADVYTCFPIPTIIPFRDNPSEVRIVRLREQYQQKRLEFVGNLLAEHMSAIDAILTTTPYIQPNLKPFILPVPSDPENSTPPV